MTPLVGFKEEQYFACKADRGFHLRLKNMVDAVMRFAISRHLSPGLTLSFQKKPQLRAFWAHMATKFPEGNFKHPGRRMDVRPRLRRKLSRKREKGSASAPASMVIYCSLSIATYISVYAYVFDRSITVCTGYSERRRPR